MQEFREVVRRRLRELGWSYMDLERASGVRNSVVWYWLDADPPRRPSPKNLERIASPLGVPYEDLMRMCDYLPGAPREQMDARRQAIRDQLDRWITAVGPEYEPYFWDYLKAQGDASVDLIRQLRTAVNEGTEAAVNAAVTEQPKRGSSGRRRGGGPLSADERAASEPLDLDELDAEKLCAA